MKQENKELLLKDLCARLPYGVKCYDEAQREVGVFKHFEYDGFGRIHNGRGVRFIENIKPYLFPLSSMTKEQESYLHFNTKFRLDICNDLTVKIDEDDSCFYTDTYDYISLIDWLNKNHFDYRGLIEKGLAIDATGLNIY